MEDFLGGELLDLFGGGFVDAGGGSLGDVAKEGAAEVFAALGELEEKVVDAVLFGWMHAGDGSGDGVGFANDQLITAEAEDGGVGGWVVEDAFVELVFEAVDDGVGYGDGLFFGSRHGGWVVRFWIISMD